MVLQIFFLTITTNPYWVEIEALKIAGYTNTSISIARIFHQRLTKVIEYLKNSKILGEINAYISRVEYQQRGLPHAHILLWTSFDIDDIEKIDSVIAASLMDEDSRIDNIIKQKQLNHLISRYETHICGPRCLKNSNVCCYGFPKSPVDKTHFENYKIIFKRSPESSRIVQFIPKLLVLLRAHHEIEIIRATNAIGYVLKYCTKNSDSATITLTSRVLYCGKEVPSDDYLHRYYAEAVFSNSEIWAKLNQYHNFTMHPSVSLIPIHLPGEKIIMYKPGLTDSQILAKANENMSKLERYFARPNIEEFENIKLCEYYAEYSVSSKETENSIPDNGNPTKFIKKKKYY